MYSSATTLKSKHNYWIKSQKKLTILWLLLKLLPQFIAMHLRYIECKKVWSVIFASSWEYWQCHEEFLKVLSHFIFFSNLTQNLTLYIDLLFWRNVLLSEGKGLGSGKKDAKHDDYQNRGKRDDKTPDLNWKAFLWWGSYLHEALLLHFF